MEPVRWLEFFNLVFFAVLVSTVARGATVELLAKCLGISAASQD
jgi:NhaP-type Na+/H+ and K+/H+ antiporter